MSSIIKLTLNTQFSSQMPMYFFINKLCITYLSLRDQNVLSEYSLE